jgi:uncharacterized protein YggL (DUF469 family)
MPKRRKKKKKKRRRRRRRKIHITKFLVLPPKLLAPFSSI